MNETEKKIDKLYDQMEIGFTQIALELAQELNELGIEEGTFCLSTFYHYGHIVEQNYNKEFKLLKKAATHGSKRAKFNIASSYLNGLGVKENKRKAHKIMKKLADDDYEPAIMFIMNRLIASGQITMDDLDKDGVPFVDVDIPNDVAKKMGLDEIFKNTNQVVIPVSIK